MNDHRLSWLTLALAAGLLTSVTLTGCRSDGLDGSGAPPAVVASGPQQILTSASTLTVEEGASATFTVTLSSPPSGAVTVGVASSDPTSLPLSPATLVFDTNDYAAPKTVTVSAPVDANTVSETATLTLTLPGAESATLAAAVDDRTQTVTYGWSTPFADTTDIDAGTVIGYQINVTTTADLSTFALFSPAAAGDFRMALYDDSNNAPNNLVAAMPLRQTLVNGANVATLTTPVHLDDGRYWVMLRTSTTMAIGEAPVTQPGPQCYRDVNITSLDDPWPQPFGAASCASAPLLNLAAGTSFQRP